MINPWFYLFTVIRSYIPILPSNHLQRLNFSTKWNFLISKKIELNCQTNNHNKNCNKCVTKIQKLFKIFLKKSTYLI